MLLTQMYVYRHGAGLLLYIDRSTGACIAASNLRIEDIIQSMFMLEADALVDLFRWSQYS
jgi:hypothetical protein